jgi:hypothetical protein
MLKNIKDSDVSIVTDYIDIGRDEFGGSIEVAVFNVMVEDEAGARMIHNRTYNTATPCLTPDGFGSYIDHTDEARAEVGRLADKIRAHGVIDLDYWTGVQPCYGSEAYVAYGGDQAMGWGDC